MWGLDAGNDQNQPSISNCIIPARQMSAIDSNLEWVISVGEVLPTGFAAIDTINNNPATGYWAVLRVRRWCRQFSQRSRYLFSSVDLVSMSRVTDATDGTAAASWAASMRPSANISGRRVGNTGCCECIYVMPAPPEDPPAESTLLPQHRLLKPMTS